MSDMLKKLEAVYKAAATDFKINGTLTDQQTEAWFTSVVNKSNFLSRVTTRLRNKLSGNTGFIEGSDQVFGRTDEGSDIAEGAHHTQRFNQYLLQDLDAAAFVGYSVLDDNPGAALLDKINEVIDTSIGNSLQNLAINGTTDTYDGNDFFTLKKGWIQLAKDDADTRKVPLVADDGRLDDLDALVQEMVMELDQEDREKALVVMSDNERIRRNDKLVRLSNSDAQAVAIASMDRDMRYTVGHKPVVTPFFWPDGVFMVTDPMNLEVDIHRVVRRVIEEKARRKGFEYTKGDFALIESKRTCIAYQA